MPGEHWSNSPDRPGSAKNLIFSFLWSREPSGGCIGMCMECHSAVLTKVIINVKTSFCALGI